MDTKKEFDKISKGITSSSSKRKVLFERLERFVETLKKSWYKKLLVKLERIKNNELSLDDYIEEVRLKTE